MRSLLDKELRAALARRGLRERPWAVEVDESAYAFLIEKGFSAELGARPLRRAIEQHLLVPLAQAIVEQTVPEGDQFLLVGAPGGTSVEVTFVDLESLIHSTPSTSRIGSTRCGIARKLRRPCAIASGSRPACCTASAAASAFCTL